MSHEKKAKEMVKEMFAARDHQLEQLVKPRVQDVQPKKQSLLSKLENANKQLIG